VARSLAFNALWVCIKKEKRKNGSRISAGLKTL
jgi:hypothetical protein